MPRNNRRKEIPPLVPDEAMHDLRAIRENKNAFDNGLARRGLEPMSASILELDSRRRAAQTTLQGMKSQRNTLTKEIGMAKHDGQPAEGLMAAVDELKENILQLERQERSLGAELELLLASIPNLPADDVPDGRDETANVEIRRLGEPLRTSSSKEH